MQTRRLGLGRRRWVFHEYQHFWATFETIANSVRGGLCSLKIIVTVGKGTRVYLPAGPLSHQVELLYMPSKLSIGGEPEFRSLQDTLSMD